MKRKKSKNKKCFRPKPMKGIRFIKCERRQTKTSQFLLVFLCTLTVYMCTNSEMINHEHLNTHRIDWQTHKFKTVPSNNNTKTTNKLMWRVSPDYEAEVLRLRFIFCCCCCYFFVFIFHSHVYQYVREFIFLHRVKA